MRFFWTEIYGLWLKRLCNKAGVWEKRDSFHSVNATPTALFPGAWRMDGFQKRFQWACGIKPLLLAVFEAGSCWWWVCMLCKLEYLFKRLVNCAFLRINSQIDPSPNSGHHALLSPWLAKQNITAIKADSRLTQDIAYIYGILHRNHFIILSSATAYETTTINWCEDVINCGIKELFLCFQKLVSGKLHTFYFGSEASYHQQYMTDALTNWAKSPTLNEL